MSIGESPYNVRESRMEVPEEVRVAKNRGRVVGTLRLPLEERFG